MKLFKRKQVYTLAEVNEYIANYEKLNHGNPKTSENDVQLHVMREVIERLNESILRESK